MKNQKLETKKNLWHKIVYHVGYILFWLPAIALILFGVFLWPSASIEGESALKYAYYRLPLAVIIVIYCFIFLRLSLIKIFKSEKIKSKIGYIFLSIIICLIIFAFTLFAIINPIKAFPYRNNPVKGTLSNWEAYQSDTTMDEVDYSNFYLSGKLVNGENKRFEITLSTFRKLNRREKDKLNVIYYPHVDIIQEIEGLE